MPPKKNARELAEKHCEKYGENVVIAKRDTQSGGEYECVISHLCTGDDVCEMKKFREIL